MHDHEKPPLVDCPDCGWDIDEFPGAECSNCGHVYWPDEPLQRGIPFDQVHPDTLAAIAADLGL